MNIKSIRNILSYIKNHETSQLLGSGVPRFFLWQIQTRLFGVTEKIMPWVNNSKLIITKGRPTSTANLYVGMSDFQEMSFLCHFLRNQDLVGDVGANVGIYSVLCGKALGAKVIAFEPDQSTIQLLKANIVLNDLVDHVTINEMAVGGYQGVISFTKGLDAINHIQSSGESGMLADVKVDTLDNVFCDSTPVVLKIDIEGFETEALNGAAKLLGNPDLKAIIIELNGLGQRYGFNDKHITDKLLSYGFKPYKYDPIKQKLTCIKYSNNITNYIFLRDLDFIENRILTSNAFTIWGKRI